MGREYGWRARMWRKRHVRVLRGDAVGAGQYDSAYAEHFHKKRRYRNGRWVWE